MNRTETRKELLTLAQDLLQRRGASGFSFQDLADRLKIRKASIHYHFKTKDELLTTLLRNYRDSFTQWSERMQGRSAADKWSRYLRLFRNFAEDGGKLCPAGALGADVALLPLRLRKELRELQIQQRQWLEELIAEGQAQGFFRSDLNPRWTAIVAGSTIQGALQISRLHEAPPLFEKTLQSLEGLLRSTKGGT